MVLLNKNGSCLIIDMFLLKDSSLKSFKLTSSKYIFPLVASNILVIKLNSVDLPCPDLPTTAIFLLGANETEKSFKVASSLG